MKKVILSQNTKIAVFYDTLDNPEIENLVENSFKLKILKMMSNL